MSGKNSRLPTGRPSGRWWGVLAAYVGHGMRQVSAGATCVWLVLFRNSRDGVVTRSREQIAATTGYTPKHVGRLLRELVSAGFLRVERRGRKQSGPTRYRILPIPRVQECPLGNVVPRVQECPLDQDSQGCRNVPPSRVQECPPSP